MIDQQFIISYYKTAFQLIKRFSIALPMQRDGGIMKCYLTKYDNDLRIG
jgi:hypothetical protein